VIKLAPRLSLQVMLIYESAIMDKHVYSKNSIILAVAQELLMPEASI
jgi:uncharacterized protein YqgQ